MKKSLRYALIVLIVGLGSVGCSEHEKKNRGISDIVHNKPTILQSTQQNQAISGNTKAKRVEKTPASAVFLRKTILKVKELFGKPDFTRKEGQALVLQYQTDLCILDIFFYGKNETKVSTYFEFRPRNNIKINIQKCMNRMLTSKKISIRQN